MAKPTHIRSANREMHRGADEGGQMGIGKDWGGVPGNHIAPTDPRSEYPDPMYGVVYDSVAPEF